MVLFLHEFKAWVTIDDQETEEYQFKYLPEQNVVYCWIASEVGKRFQIHWEDTKRATATDGHVVVDGNKCGGSVLSTDPDKPSCTSKSGIRTSPTTIHPFKFSQIKLTDDDTCADPKLSETELGQIDLYIFRVKIKYTEDHVGLTIPEQQSLHERAKKAIQHQTTFNDTLKSSTPKKAVRLKQLSKQPVATFRFIYRPLEMLQAKGIAPSRNEPEIKPKTETNSPESVKSEFKPAIPSQSESRTPPAPTPSATVAPTRITPASSSRDVSLPSWDTIPPPTSYAFSLLSSVVKDEEDEDDDDDEGEDVAAHHTLQVAEEEYSRKTDPEDFHIPSPALPTPKPTPTPTPAFHPKKEEGEQATERQYSLLVPGSGMSAMDAIVIDDDDDDCGEASMAYNGEVEGREILEERRDKSFSYGVSSATTTATTTTAVASAASSSDRTRDPRWRAPSTSDGVNGNNSSSTPGLEMDISTGNKRKRATSTHRSLSAAETPFGVNEKEEEEEEEYRKRIKFRRGGG
ncbi:hypothetical protein GYMLUDRAFT_913229 [Collybiopsis luxurians FD-317 M1]|nr:hypothetical protein GYMLUDRAFT_913229 [Collybiopsis luxurians FD-317 M1]